MIKFNNYPPQSAEDVEYTEAAKKLLSIRRHITQSDEKEYDRSPVRLFAYGEAIGQTLLAATNGDSELFSVIAEPLLQEAYNLRPSSHRQDAAALAGGLYSAIGESGSIVPEFKPVS